MTDELMLLGLNKSEAVFVLAGLCKIIEEIKTEMAKQVTKPLPAYGTALRMKRDSLKDVLDHGQRLFDKLKAEYEEAFEEKLEF